MIKQGFEHLAISNELLKFLFHDKQLAVSYCFSQVELDLTVK